MKILKWISENIIFASFIAVLLFLLAWYALYQNRGIEVGPVKISSPPEKAASAAKSADQAADCTAAQIAAPFGTHQQQQASKFSVPRSFQILWNPSSCPMIVQVYQNGTLVHELRPPVLSGVRMEIPASGETELKIWYESGSGSLQTDSLWVWAK